MGQIEDIIKTEKRWVPLSRQTERALHIIVIINLLSIVLLLLLLLLLFCFVVHYSCKRLIYFTIIFEIQLLLISVYYTP